MNNRIKEPGIIRLGSNKWRVVCRIRVDGLIRHRQETITGTREQARDLLACLKRELRESAGKDSLTYTEISTFGDVLRFYLERHDAGRSMPYFKRLIADLGKCQLAFIASRFDAYLQLLKSSKGQRTGKPIKNGTLNQYILRSKAALNYAMRLELIKENPLNRFEKFKETPRDVILSELDKQRLLNVIENEAPHLSAIVRFALQVPCRKSELVNMTVDDMDLFNNVIRIRNGETKNGMGVWKPIPPDMQNYFRSIPACCKYLFYRQDSKGFHPLGDFKNAWHTCLKLAGISDFRFHDTRHCSASALIDNGTPEQVVMTIAGWKTNMLRTYYHREPKKALELVRFYSKCDSAVIVSKAQAL
jgi:integrase